jgi:hypothetical protein
MKLVKTTEAVEHPSSVGVLPAGREESATVDQDVVRAWELKSQTQWVRNDRGLINGFRWFLLDRYGLGHPPAGVEKKPVPYESTPSVPTLRLVALEDGVTAGIGSFEDSAQLGAVEHS